MHVSGLWILDIIDINCVRKQTLGHTQQTQNICITFIQCPTNVERPSVFDVGPTLHKCYTNVLCLLGMIYNEDEVMPSNVTLTLVL